MRPVYLAVNRLIAGRAFVWGRSDCMTVIADWVRERTGTDPMRDLRGTYASAAECQRVTGYFRDPVGVVAAQLEGVAGLVRTEFPQAGDVGVVEVRQPDGLHSVGAICLGRSWAAKAEGDGPITFRPVRVLAAWDLSDAF